MTVVVRIVATPCGRVLFEKGHDGASWCAGNVLYLDMNGDRCVCIPVKCHHPVHTETCVFTGRNVLYLNINKNLSVPIFQFFDPSIRHSQREN